MVNMPETAIDPHHPTAWSASIETTPELWTVRLTDEELHALGDPASSTLEKLAAEIRDRLLTGLGFVLLRGLPVDEWGGKATADAFLHLSRALGSLRSQNAAGDLLGHVRDTGLSSTDPNVRIYQTNERQTFHTDSVDAVGLCCLRTARSGGDSLLVSARSIHQRMAAERPDLAARLFEPVATDRRGEIPEGADPFFSIPPLSWHAGFLSVLYQRQYINAAQRLPGAPRLDTETTAALDLFDDIANDPGLHVRMRLGVGDIQFVHNHSMLHDRTGFEDWPDPKRRRHLLRSWVSLPGDRPLPAVYAQRFGSLVVGDRGGVVTPSTSQRVDLSPISI